MTSLPTQSPKLSPGRLGFATCLFLLCFAILMSGAKADALPNIVGRDLDGKITSLHKSFNGRPMVINFWWIKCAPCKKELPDLIAKSKAHPNVDFIYVHAETNAKTKSPYTIEAVSGFLDTRALTLDKVIIGNTKARKSAGIDALPTTLLVNESGRVAQKLIGFTPENTAAIKTWLTER
jgi:thiol-disulfide isomerase/thioredoxin